MNRERERRNSKLKSSWKNKFVLKIVFFCNKINKTKEKKIKLVIEREREK